MAGHATPDANQVEIIVNTRPKSVPHGRISYDEIIALALDPFPTGPNIQITVTYFRRQGEKSGDLVAGQSVEVHAGMIFDVTATDLS